MSLLHNTDLGYGIRVKKHEPDGDRPAGYIVEIHFYDKSKAVSYASQLIVAARKEAEAQWAERL